jgi:hypothetical protein
MQFFALSFEWILIYLSTSTLNWWRSQWGVMAASHCHSWQWWYDHTHSCYIALVWPELAWILLNLQSDWYIWWITGLQRGFIYFRLWWGQRRYLGWQMSRLVSHRILFVKGCVMFMLHFPTGKSTVLCVQVDNTTSDTGVQLFWLTPSLGFSS